MTMHDIEDSEGEGPEPVKKVVHVGISSEVSSARLDLWFIGEGV